ncbi:MAG TPA: BatA domain-containing protein [Thermoanaerobaculia bacterium]|nr:BatA domain-containing protein [Thermoanaerobaculia bacterium]
MVPFLTSPLALLALLGVPALIAIYLFQRRFRVREVSSLMLWDVIRQPASGGRKRERLQLPLTFWLEVLAVILLALAAAGPLLPRWSRSRPVVIVCDDSLSMQAGDARAKAISFAEGELAKHNFSPVRILVAGATPRFEKDFAQWTATSPSADLDAAIALAASAAGRSALVLVLTDHPPDRPPDPGRIRWQAFGRALPNLGFVSAARAGDRVLLEIANDGGVVQSTSLRVAGSTMRVEVPPRSRHRVQLNVPGGAIEATLGDDAAAFDNRVVLLPDRRPPLRVALRVQEETIESALRATSRVALEDIHPQLVITDRATNEEWSVEVQRGAGGAAFVGPYVMDRTSPLTTGLRLDGLVWGAARGGMQGQPVVLAGDQPLVTVDGHRVRIRFDRTISNLHHSPAWPALWWNLVEWRSAQLPGPRSANVSLGSNAFVNLETPSAVVIAPDGDRRTVSGPAAVIAATQPGIWKVGPYSFACNALAPGETDLTHNRSGGWGKWNDEALESAGFENIAWILLLLALAALIAHQRVTGAEGFSPPRAT